jgi:hypothetical protein
MVSDPAAAPGPAVGRRGPRHPALPDPTRAHARARYFTYLSIGSLFSSSICLVSTSVGT